MIERTREYRINALMRIVDLLIDVPKYNIAIQIHGWNIGFYLFHNRNYFASIGKSSYPSLYLKQGWILKNSFSFSFTVFLDEIVKECRNLKEYKNCGKPTLNTFQMTFQQGKEFYHDFYLNVRFLDPSYQGKGISWQLMSQYRLIKI